MMDAASQARYWSNQLHMALKESEAQKAKLKDQLEREREHRKALAEALKVVKNELRAIDPENPIL